MALHVHEPSEDQLQIRPQLALRGEISEVPKLRLAPGGMPARTAYEIVHDELLRIGFAGYVEQRRRAGAVRLFPDLKADKYGTYTKMFSTWFNEYLDARVIDDRRFVGHSFRHTFEEHGGRSGLTQYQLDGILGHTPEGMAGRYGKKIAGRRTYDPKVLADGMRRFRIEGLDLQHLHGAY